MNGVEALTAVFAAVGCTLFMRALPFALLRKDHQVPAFIRYLGNILPAAIMAVLVIYCLRNVGTDLTGSGIKQILAVGLTAAVHLWKKNTYLSIIAGTAFYMLLLAV